MSGTKMTEYTFNLKGVKVVLCGSDTDENYQKAIDEAIQKVKSKIDQDWIGEGSVHEYMDYENKQEE